MSVKVTNLVKEFGTQRAVDNITFEARKGEVLGFLGPNGAGKSTTMKIISCFIPATSGKVEVCGFDVQGDPMAVRNSIGYLPEHNPLYREMYIREYLEFVADVHRLPHKSERVSEMIQLTGLSLEKNKKIGALSKGYRQRVGLAQAMLHDPEVLILDEPTSGLDPNQLVEIRTLIKNLGKEKTVIFSTHIMQEVQAICDRVVIINRGKIVADDPIERLKERVRGETSYAVAFSQKVDGEALKKIKGVLDVRSEGQNQFSLTAPANVDIREAIFLFAVTNKLTLLELHREVSSVEDVFQFLTRNKT